MKELSEWKKSIIQNISLFENKFISKESVFIENNKINTDEITLWTKSEFYKRSQKKYTTTWAEQNLSDEYLASLLAKLQIRKDEIIIDAGCGDGRFVHFLLDRGYSKIVAFNYEYEPLARLSSNIKGKDKEKVFMLCGDVFNLPFKNNFSKFVLAWGLFSSTCNYLKSMEICLNMLEVGGYLFNAEPVLEQAIVYSLIHNDINEMMRIMSSRSRARMWSEKDNRYEIYSQAELNKLMEMADNIRILCKNGINALPSFVFGGVCSIREISDEDKEQVWNIIKETDFSWYRQLTFLSQKVKN